MKYIKNTFFSIALIILVMPRVFASSSASAAIIPDAAVAAVATEPTPAVTGPAMPIISQSRSFDVDPADEGSDPETGSNLDDLDSPAQLTWSESITQKAGAFKKSFNRDNARAFFVRNQNLFGGFAFLATCGIGLKIAYDKSPKVKKAIDSYIEYSKSLIDKFRNSKKAKIAATVVLVLVGGYLAYNKHNSWTRKKPVISSPEEQKRKVKKIRPDAGFATLRATGFGDIPDLEEIKPRPYIPDPTSLD